MASPSRIKYGLTLAQRRPFVASVTGFCVLVALDALLNGGRFGGGWGTAALGLVLVGMAIAFRWVGALLTDDGVEVHALPVARIPWHDITEVEVESQLGFRAVVLHHGDGRRTRLNAPATGPLGRDERFAEKAATIRDMWMARRADATAPATPRPDGDRARPLRSLSPQPGVPTTSPVCRAGARSRAGAPARRATS